MIPTLESYVDWRCPNCGLTDRTPANLTNRLHPCPKLPGSMIAPLIREGQSAKIFVREREDYIGREQVQLMGGRPVMALITERSDGSNDATVYAPTARGRLVSNAGKPRKRLIPIPKEA